MINKLYVIPASEPGSSRLVVPDRDLGSRSKKLKGQKSIFEPKRRQERTMETKKTSREGGHAKGKRPMSSQSAERPMTVVVRRL